MVSIHQTDNASANGTSSSTAGFQTDDQQISDLMVLPEAMVSFNDKFIIYVYFEELLINTNIILLIISFT